MRGNMIVICSWTARTASSSAPRIIVVSRVVARIVILATFILVDNTTASAAMTTTTIRITPPVSVTSAAASPASSLVVVKSPGYQLLFHQLCILLVLFLYEYLFLQLLLVGGNICNGTDCIWFILQGAEKERSQMSKMENYLLNGMQWLPSPMAHQQD